MSQYRVIVTGATGFLGGHCVRDLAARHDVIGIGRSRVALDALADAGLMVQQVDLSHRDAAQTLAEFQPDIVVHAAALSSLWGARSDFERANVVATENVLRLCEKTRARLVHISTPAVYMNETDRLMLNEEAELPVSFVHDYAATKFIAEQRVQAADVPAAILRPQALVGAHDTTIAPRFLRVAERGFLPLAKGVDPLLDMTHVRNVTAAIELACHELVTNARNGVEVFNITNGDPQPLSSLLALFVKTWTAAGGRPVRNVAVPKSILTGVASMLEHVSKTTGREALLTQYSVELLTTSRTLNIDKAQRQLGYDPSGFGLEDAFVDYFEHRP